MMPEDVRDIVRETVRETLESLGFDLRNPTETQADMQALREWRLIVRRARGHVVITLLGILVTGACAALWLGLKTWMRRE